MRSLTTDSLPHVVHCLAMLASSRLHTAVARLVAAWWGVELGPRCSFYGVPLFRRHPGSRIRIGRACVFRSTCASNPLGVNHRCLVSTLSEQAVVNIGAESGFSGSVIAAMAEILIGDRVLCGANTVITDTDWHALQPSDRLREVPPLAAPVHIGADVFIGMNSVVLKGVSIGAGSVVAANSVVVSDIPGNVLAAGVPARVVRELV